MGISAVQLRHLVVGWREDSAKPVLMFFSFYFDPTISVKKSQIIKISYSVNDLLDLSV